MDGQDIEKLMSPELLDFKESFLELYDAPYARDIGIEIGHLSSDEMSLYIDIIPKHINSRGFVHGAVIYALTDHTLAFAASYEDDCVGQCTNIVYHRPLKEGHLVSKSRLINKSNTLRVFEINTYCNGKLISSSTCTAFKVGEKK